MFLAPIVRPTAVLTINSSTSDVDLYSAVNNPTYPLNVLCFVNAPVTGSSPSGPAFRTSSTWTPGTWIYVENNSTITGSKGIKGTTGTTGSKGTTGSTGSHGSTGSDGSGGQDRKSTRLNSSH